MFRCIISHIVVQFRHNEVVGALPKSRFPGTDQGSTLQAGLSKESCPGPTMIKKTLFCMCSFFSDTVNFVSFIQHVYFDMASTKCWRKQVNKTVYTVRILPCIYLFPAIR